MWTGRKATYLWLGALALALLVYLGFLIGVGNPMRSIERVNEPILQPTQSITLGPTGVTINDTVEPTPMIAADSPLASILGILPIIFVVVIFLGAVAAVGRTGRGD